MLSFEFWRDLFLLFTNLNYLEKIFVLPFSLSQVITMQITLNKEVFLEFLNKDAQALSVGFTIGSWVKWKSTVNKWKNTVKICQDIMHCAPHYLVHACIEAWVSQPIIVLRLNTVMTYVSHHQPSQLCCKLAQLWTW